MTKLNQDAEPSAIAPVRVQPVVGPPNKYDQAFFRWFKARGWRILAGLGEIAVWSHDDICCPFKVTTGMIERLEAAGMLKQWIPDNCGIWDRWYVANDRWPNDQALAQPERNQTPTP